MNIPIYQIDAFTTDVFCGNPAAVCPLESWLPVSTMQKIATENNLSETAFFVPKNDYYELRWFTPEVEVDLCGHATLATAYVIFEILNLRNDSVKFFSPRSGDLYVAKKNDLLEMDFPASPPVRCKPPAGLVSGLGCNPVEVLHSEDYLALFHNEDEVRGLNPDMQMLNKLDKRGVIVTAKGDDVDFVCRFFASGLGVDEDPVTGSAHCTLIPYWQKILEKNSMISHQVSARGGELLCEHRGDRVTIAGKAVTYLQGKITI